MPPEGILEGLRSVEIGDKIPPSLPLPKGGIPLFGKEGLGEIRAAFHKGRRYVFSMRGNVVYYYQS
ncbi:MAG: hypothetical protein A2Z51_09275 [Deltaproteobacteria bacterium RBG_19FT_COMBO_52_11]|nr:MAG: hypothetical protein A2Z51_09275 [Deltaproteobacteria bacterium RBG_19FT_COMBO_52_11]